MSLNILIVEGNIPEDSEVFIRAAGASASENLKNLVLKLEPNTNVKIINPGKDEETKEALENISHYHGIIFTGGAMRINDMTDEIKKHINFASNCFKHDKKILAICWGLQVCSTAAGGKVAPATKGAHIGIASDVSINEEGKKNLIYKNNNVMGMNFKSGNSEIWGLQYHPDYEYYQMVNLSNERKDRMIKNKYFKDEEEFQNHINYIKQEDKKLDFENRTREIRNWLDFVKSKLN